jgi:hypothetical protein
MGKFFSTNNTKHTSKSESNTQSENLVTSTQRQHEELKASLFLQSTVAVAYIWNMGYSLKIFRIILVITNIFRKEGKQVYKESQNTNNTYHLNLNEGVVYHNL